MSKLIYELVIKNNLFLEWYKVNKILKKEYANDKKFIMYLFNSEFLPELINQFSADFYLSMSKNIRSDAEVMSLVVSKDPYAFQYAESNIKSNYEIVKKAVSLNGTMLEYASSELQNNEEIVSIAIGLNNDKSIGKYHDGNNLKYASDRFKKDKKFVLYAVKSMEKNSIEIYGYFLNDVDVMNIVISRFPYVIEDAQIEVDNIDIAKKLLDENWWYFRYLSNNLKNNDEIVALALNKNFLNIYNCNSRILNNIEFIKIPFNNTYESFSEKCLRNDKDVQKTFNKIISNFKNDIELAKYILKKDANYFKLFNPYLKDNLEVCNIVIDENYNYYDMMGESVKNNREIILKYINNFKNINNILNVIVNHDDIFLGALKYNRIQVSKNFLIENIKNPINNKNIAIELLKRNELAYNFLSNDLRNDRDILTLAGIINTKKDEENINEVNQNIIEYSKNLTRMLETEEKNKNLLYQKLNLLEQENETLKKENEDLKNKLHELETSEKVLVKKQK